MDLVEDLGIGSGMTAVVGAGGKKTTLYTAATAIDRAVLTTTVRIPRFDEHVAELVQTRDPVSVLEAVEDWPVGLVPGFEEARYLGYDLDVVEEIAASGLAEAVLVKADGARNREFKAPGDDEPRIPSGADRVLAIASAHIVGKPLSEDYVHRIERVAALTGLDPGDTIGIEDVATVLASPKGARKNVPADAELIPVLNKVDNEAHAETAREIAERVLDRSPIGRVALTRLIDPENKLVEIVE